jgi:hypothetical protein
MNTNFNTRNAGDIMETRIDEAQEIVIFNVKISKKQLQLLGLFLTITAVAGVILFFVKHS